MEVVVPGGATANTEEAAQHSAAQINVFKVVLISLFLPAF
jgi:hypothetical protein